jgi:hypothetical protein
VTYSFNRKRGVQGCMGAAVVSLAAAFIGLGIIFPVRAIGIFAIVFGLVIAWLALSLILDIFAPNPILRIGPEGIYFLPFSTATVPWSAITSVSKSQGYYFNGGGVTGPDGKFSFRYSIRDPSAYPKRGGISGLARATMSGNTVTLNTLTLVDAAWPDLLAAFQEHYPGELTEVPIPGASSAP